MFDVLIRGGKLIDGSGNPWMRSDVAINGDRIVAVGALSQAGATRVIEAQGCVVAPGFIDSHSHSDWTLLANPGADSSLHQGVTTEITGNCGLGYAPVTDLSRVAVEKMAELYMPGVALEWQTFGQYLDRIEEARPGINLAVFAAHGPVRRSVVGMANRPSTPGEQRIIERALSEALDAGAIGVSFGLEYMPGRTASREELLAMCRIAGEQDRMTAWHMRNRDRHFEESTGEIISLISEAGVGAQLSHLSAKPGSSTRAWNRVMEQVELARAQGCDVTADMIPFTIGPGLLANILPDWIYDGGLEKTITRLRDPEIRARLKGDCDRYWLMIAAGEWEKVTLTASTKFSALSRLTFAEIAEKRGGDPFDAIFDILAEEGEAMDQVWINGQLFSEGQIREWISHPLVMLASDGWTTKEQGPIAAVANHPNCYGWTAEILGRCVRESQFFSLAEAIRKMTSLPAARFGLVDRGLIRPGMVADIVVFDAERVTNRATYLQPHRYASGFHTVLVNGEIVLEDGKLTGARAGKLLRT
jgi:N-acyl-D-amino-acid deacylase